MIDIDHFKVVNDTYGHPVGDEALKYLAVKMSEVVREEDACVRLGGEEFILLLAETDTQDAMIIAENTSEKCSRIAKSDRRLHYNITRGR